MRPACWSFIAWVGRKRLPRWAYGTETIGAVDKIVGPGNLYVTAAKVAVSQRVGIDMPAGPTEIVVTSETGDPSGIAADLVAQAEHDPEALAVLITSKAELAEEVALEVKRLAQTNAIAQQSLAAQGFAFVTATVDEARALTNRLAPGASDGGCGVGPALGCGMRPQCLWGIIHRSRWATTSAGRTMCCPRDAMGCVRRRVECAGLCEGDYRAAVHAECAARGWAAYDCAWLRLRGWSVMRRV